MKSLKEIQLFAKIGRILSTIFFICAIVALAASVLGSISIFAFKDMKIGNVTIKPLIETDSTVNNATALAELITTAVASAGMIFLGHKAKSFFKHEIETGHPFTMELAKEMRTLGIYDLCIKVAVYAICTIGIEIARVSHPEIASLDNWKFSFGIGIAFIIISFICEYAAQKMQEMQQTQNEPETPAE